MTKVTQDIQLFFLLICISIPGSLPLKCYNCIALSCPDSHPFLCDRAKHFVLEKLADVYYSYGSRIPFCPEPFGEDDAWRSLASSSPSCGEENEGDTTCVLGRFRATTMITDTGMNVTSYGSAMGCAKRKLLEFVRTATRKSECSLINGQSVTKDSLRHFLEIEHCSIISEVCRGNDFCISPESSVIKIFNDSEQASHFPFVYVLLGAIFLIGIMVGALFLVGIKMDS